MTTKRTQNGNRNRKQLEAEADEVRAQLMDKVSELDERRDKIVRAVKIASKPPLSIALMVAAGAAVSVFVAYQIRKSRKSPLERFVEAWLIPQEAPQPDGVVARTLKGALVSVAVTSLKEIGRRSVDRLVGDVEPRPAVSGA